MSASLASKVTEIKQLKPLPAPNSDFYPESVKAATQATITGD
jgi:hypothetical protein